jgi:hypothetical protein
LFVLNSKTIKKKLKKLRVLITVARKENHADSNNIIIILSFITLNNCFAIESKIVFSEGFKCYLWIDKRIFLTLLV